jgi:hypothetical protein
MYHDFTWCVGAGPFSSTGCINLNTLEPCMRRLVRVITTILPVAALAACVSPTAPAPSAEVQCTSGKIPYASCGNRDYVNPLGDYVNPLGDYVNPLGSRSVRSE